MAVTRADSFTALKKTTDLFTDFLNNFNKTPIGNQLGKVINTEAINQSITNIIKTNIGERLFQPTIGSDVNASLFEPNSIILKNDVEFYIRNSIAAFERRVNLIEVYVDNGIDEYNNTTRQDSNSLLVRITYNLINNPTPISFDLILKRIR